MKKFAAIFAFALALASPASAGVHIIGVAVENLAVNGAPLDGTFDLSFELYGSQTGPDLLFVEDVVGAPIINGVLVHDLGSVSGSVLPEAVLKRDQVFLEVFLDGDSIAPRTPIRSRSEIAQTAETLNGFTETDFMYFAAVDGGLQLGSDNAFSIKDRGGGF